MCGYGWPSSPIHLALFLPLSCSFHFLTRNRLICLGSWFGLVVWNCFGSTCSKFLWYADTRSCDCRAPPSPPQVHPGDNETLKGDTPIFTFSTRPAVTLCGWEGTKMQPLTNPSWCQSLSPTPSPSLVILVPVKTFPETPRCKTSFTTRTTVSGHQSQRTTKKKEEERKKWSARKSVEVLQNTHHGLPVIETWLFFFSVRDRASFVYYF